MDIRTFRASSIQEALTQVRQALGPDAAVLQTRELRRNRLGLFAQSVIEVHACSNRELHAPEYHSTPANGPPLPTPTPDLAMTGKAESSATIANLSPQHWDGNQQATPPTSMEPGKPDSEAAAACMSLLNKHGLPLSLAKELVSDAFRNSPAKSKIDCFPQLVRSMVARIRIGEELSLNSGQPHVIAFVGSTGVGKTTALAKLAYEYSRRGRQVGLISVDMLRLGAVDQLLYFAEQISAPLEAVSSAGELGPALQRLHDHELVFIDTAGGAPGDSQHKQNLTECLRAAQPDSIHLVVSASSSHLHLNNTLAGFACLSPTHLLISKMDEAAGLCAWLPEVYDARLPLSYLTRGQRLSQGISPASRDGLAQVLLGQLGNNASR